MTRPWAVCLNPTSEVFKILEQDTLLLNTGLFKGKSACNIQKESVAVCRCLKLDISEARNDRLVLQQVPTELI